MRRTRTALVAGVVAVLGAAPIVFGQSAGEGTKATTLAWKPGPGQLVREGSFLRNRRGRLVRGEGVWVYVFDKDAEGKAEPPMVMLPCRRLREMQQTLELQAKSLTFQTTGQVFAYDGGNYLLPTFFSVAAEKMEAPANGDGQASPAAGGSSRDPSADDLVREMSSGPKPMSAPAGQRGVTESGMETSAALREGLTIVSRRGRVVRDGGELRFVTENGAEKSDRPEPALILMPCTNLAAIERVVNRRADRAVVLMSGRVFAFEGRNYLMPTFFLEEADREGNLIPAP